ncbi:MAG: NAD(P)H-dependent oxidoreductase [Bacilli bacterium]|nr:NAD(P)H-dependent oxidoreductase [Bacilli bacterium]
MKFLVLNGSPKGKYSITLHTSLYLEKLYPEHEFKVLNVGQQIKSLEKDFSKALELIKEVDVLLFSYPVYTFIAPSQLHRFIELLKENNVDLSSKFASQITTSKHFYDMTAHKYIEDNCYDLGLKYIKGLSLDMEDLSKKEGQEDIKKYFNYLVYSVNNNLYEIKPIINYNPIENYVPTLEKVNKKEDKKVVIVADLAENDENLAKMIEDFQNGLPYESRIVNIREFPFAGGCLGCFNCAGDGKCIYKDGFDKFLREEIQTNDAIVIAFTIKDHSMGARFKMYDDRQFCNGHRTVTEGMPFMYIINGDYENEQNLKTIVEARAEVGHNFLAGVATNTETMKKSIERLVYAMNYEYVQPRNFYGVGGMKIFRDLIWIMRGIMKADHEYYKKHGVYDFPQKKRGQMMLMCLLGSMVRNKKIKAKMGNKFNEGMVAPYKKVIDKLDKKD